MARMDFASLLYSQVCDRKTLLDRFDSLLGTEMRPLTMVPYASDMDPLDCFKSRGRNRVFNVIDSYQDVILYELAFTPPRGENVGEIIGGKFFVCRHPDLEKVFIAMTIESADFLRRAFLPYFDQNRTRFYMTFIKHSDLLSLLRNFKADHGFGGLNVVRASLIGRFAEERGDTIIPWLSWPHLELDDAFRYAQEQNGWFRSLKFEASKQGRICAEVTVQRNGVVRTNGEFRTVFKSLILPICKMIHDNVEMFSKRGRRENPRLEVRPLAIEFDRDQFDDLEENRRFIEGIRQLDNASISIMHGNPYISMSIIDYADGSTFDLWVLNPREVVIVPQLTSSVAAIKRLISCIFDNYAEGTIRDHQTTMRLQ